MKIIKYGTSHYGMCMAMSKNLKDAMLPIPIIEKDCDDIGIAKEAQSIGIRNIPTTILLNDNDQEVVRWTGIVSSDVITNAIQKYTKKDSCAPKYIYIMNFFDGEIYERELTEEEQELPSEDIINKHGFSMDQCSYMLTNNKIKIKTIN